MNILAVSDVELDNIYNPSIASRFKSVELVIGCGDLPYYYLEYIVSMLNRPLYYVRGNHAPRFVEEGSGGTRTYPWGGVDLHNRVVRDPTGLLLAGVEGSVRYNKGRYQYSQSEMWGFILGMVPRLLTNRLLYGRYLDIFVTHAPPWGIHDQEDLPHHGIKAFLWLVKVFQPTYHLHGHIHVYTPNVIVQTQLNNTQVINAYGYKQIDASFPWEKKAHP